MKHPPSLLLYYIIVSNLGCGIRIKSIEKCMFSYARESVQCLFFSFPVGVKRAQIGVFLNNLVWLDAYVEVDVNGVPWAFLEYHYFCFLRTDF